jgi:hypothetical protein
MNKEKVQLNVRIPLSVRIRIRHIAIDKGLELQEVVLDAINEYMVKHQPEIERKYRGK